MARKFLYLVAALIVLVLAAGIVYRLYGEELIRATMVPTGAYEQQQALEANIYADPDMWFAHPAKKSGANPAEWLPAGVKDGEGEPGETGEAAVFFIHPTSYLARDHWNAPLADEESQQRARIFLRGQASAFNAAGEVWAPRYRQAAFGAFLTDKREGQWALRAAYRDVAAAFDQFVSEIPPEKPIILAGHSQGALHLSYLLKDRVAGTPLAARVVAAYVVGWPISRETDLEAVGLAPCARPDQANCMMSWQSFAEPADTRVVETAFDGTEGFDGRPRAGTDIVCTNPLTGGAAGDAPAEDNLGTLVPDDTLKDADLVSGSVPARCAGRGFLYIGDPPELGPYVLPGNNYHVYDYSLFWANIRADALRRLEAWQGR